MRKYLLTAALAGVVLVATAGCGGRTVGETFSDAGITTKVKSKLVADPEVNPFEIDVDTREGVVRLSGAVETESDRAEAERLARNTKGVKDVVNDIRIGDPTLKENFADAAIATKVKSKLTGDPEINAFRIDVDVVQGVVTLSGRVDKEAARDEAERLARNTKGVKEVNNRIQVGRIARN